MTIAETIAAMWDEIHRREAEARRLFLIGKQARAYKAFDSAKELRRALWDYQHKNNERE